MSRGRWRQRGPGFTDRGLQIRCLSDDQRGVVSICLNLKISTDQFFSPGKYSSLFGYRCHHISFHVS